MWSECDNRDVPQVSAEQVQRVASRTKPGQNMFACSGCCRDDATNATTRFSKDCGAISFYSQTPCIDNWLEVETIPLNKLQLVKSPNELRGISILETFAEDIDGNVHHVSKNECNVLT